MCDVCERPNTITFADKLHLENCKLNNDILYKGDGNFVIYQNDFYSPSSCNIVLKFPYCPFCGRKLYEENKKIKKDQ